MKLHRNVWLAITIVFAVCLTVLMLSKTVTQPWCTLLDIGGDGAKNNLTYLYECMYGKGYWYEGMNYPYGEHIVYTDGQPLISVLFTRFKNVTPGEALTVLWWLIGLSYILSVVYNYLLLIHFKVRRPLAIVFAGLIAVFTPQIIRLQSHYALSYTCVVPMLFYWSVLYHERAQRRYCVYIFIMGCIMSFLHPYFAAVILIWAMCYTLGYLILIKDKPAAKVRHLWPYLLSVFAVFAVVAIVMKVTDPVTDRPSAPLLTFDTCTTLKDLFTSIHSPISQLLKSWSVVPSVSERTEGYVYPGFVILITVAVAMITVVVRRIRKKRASPVIPVFSIPSIWIFLAFTALFFSMGIPFIWKMEWLLNYLSFFKQFRSLGRFSWIFYYIIAVYASVVICNAFQRLRDSRKVFAGYALLVVAIGVWGYEASGYIAFSRTLAETGKWNYDVIFSTTEQNWESYLAEHHFNKKDFQAVLLLPYFHVGTEKLWVGDGGWLISLGSKAALQLQLPVVDVMMSRSSWSQAMKQVKIAGGPFVDKPILRDIKSDKPFLVMQYEGDSLSQDQKYLLTSADYLGHYSQCYIYALYPARLAANQQKYADSIGRITPYIKPGTDTIINNTGTVYIDHVDARPAADRIFGAGSALPILHDDSILAKIPVKASGDKPYYEFSCWFLLGNKDFRSPYVTIQSLDSAGNVIFGRDALTKASVDNYKMWFRANVVFQLEPSCRYIRCLLMNVPNPAYIRMDEVMLRPTDALIISKDANGNVMVDNHIYGKSSN